MTRIYLGLDLGQAADYSALCVIEEPIWVPGQGWTAGADLTQEQRMLYAQGLWYAWGQLAPSLPPIWLKLLYRYPLRTPYPDVVSDVIRRLGGPQEQLRRDAVLIVDATGCGAPVCDMFAFGGLPCPMIKVIIHGGTKVTQDYGLHVPKRDLVASVQALLHTGRLQVAQANEFTKAWTDEMQGYRIKLTATGHDSYSAREDSVHDDLVLAVALACYYRGAENRGEQQWQHQASAAAARS